MTPNFTNAGAIGVPPIDTRSVETTVLVDNGETVVLGGVYERTKTFSKEQVPWLGDVPVLGRLFKKESRVGQQLRTPDLRDAQDPEGRDGAQLTRVKSMCWLSLSLSLSLS